MDRQIRRLGIAFVALFAVLFAQVAYVQVVAADRIANQPANAARQIRAEYAVERGQILAADRKTVLADVDPQRGSRLALPLRAAVPAGGALRTADRLLLPDLRPHRARAGDEPLPRRHRAGVHDPEPHRHHPRAGPPRRHGADHARREPAAGRPRGDGRPPGRRRRDRPVQRRRPRDVLEPGLRPAATVQRHPRPDPSGVEEADREPRHAARGARVPGPLPAGLDLQDGDGQRRARARLGPREGMAEPASPRVSPAPTSTSRTSATSTATAAHRP